MQNFVPVSRKKKTYIYKQTLPSVILFAGTCRKLYNFLVTEILPLVTT